MYMYICVYVCVCMCACVSCMPPSIVCAVHDSALCMRGLTEGVVHALYASKHRMCIV